MAENEERADAEPKESPGASESGQGEEKAGEATAPRSRGQTRPHVPAAAVFAAGLLLGAGLFMAGFWTHSLIDADIDLDPVEEKLVALEYRTGNIEESLAACLRPWSSWPERRQSSRRRPRPPTTTPPGVQRTPS